MKNPIQLGKYDNSWFHPGASSVKRAAWFFLGQPLLRSAWIPSSTMRVHVLRWFGAKIGSEVVIKPAVEVKYPWHLVVGNDCWIGEHVWIDNLTTVTLASNVCISQGAYFCTGNHDWSDPYFGLRIASITVGEGAWVGAKAILTPGTRLGDGAVATAGSVVHGVIPAFEIYSGNPARFLKQRVLKTTSDFSIHDRFAKLADALSFTDV
jgi:putative colanic acid biosynthesis acetyltransferase WcaF